MLCLRSVVMMMLLGSAVSAHAAAPRETMSVVSIRIHDYFTIDGAQLQQAERQVSDTYARIGVRVDWRPAVRPGDVEAGTASWPTDMTMITVVVLAPAMSARLHVPDDIAGYAPISRDRGGRMAFVLGDRTKAIAVDARVEQWEVLAGVITHELAHLLMPQRSHSTGGVMRAHWNPALFRHVGRQRFNETEAASIRQTLRALGAGPLRAAD